MQPMRKSVLLLMLAAAVAGFAATANAHRTDSAPVSFELRAPSAPAATLLGEFTPSTRLASGVAVEALGSDDKAALTQTVMSVLPIEDLAAALGLGAREVRWSYRSGGYQRSITPNVVVSVEPGAGRARVAALSLAWMYVYQQEAVPFFAWSDAGRAGARIAFESELTPARERAMFAALVEAQGSDAGYTRLNDREILVIDFDGRGRLGDELDRFRALMAATNRVVRTEAFVAQCSYREHDWHADPAGDALLGELARTVPGADVAALRAMRSSYERLVARWLERMPEAREVSLTRP